VAPRSRAPNTDSLVEVDPVRTGCKFCRKLQVCGRSLYTRTCIQYIPRRERGAGGSSRAIGVKRSDHPLALPGAVPEQRCLLGLPEGTVPSRRSELPEVRQIDQVSPGQEPHRVLLPILPAPGLPHEGNDLREVHHQLATLVLGHLSHVLHSLPHLGQAVGARDRRDLQDGRANVPRHSDLAGRRGLS